MVDALDIRILRCMGIQPYGKEPRALETLKASHIAKRIKTSTERVRDRIARMEQSGIIGGYELFPNYRHLGLAATWFYLEIRDEDLVDAAIDKIEPVEGVVGCCAFVGGLLCINVHYRSLADLARKLRLLESLIGKGEAQKFYDVDMPRVDRPLAGLDWRIIKALREDARRPVREVARDARVSEKTVKRRLDRMAQEGSIFVIPLLDPSRAEGILMFSLAVRFAPDAGPSSLVAVEAALRDHMVAVDRTEVPQLGSHAFLLAARSMGEVEALRKATAKVQGVAGARALLFRDARENWSWLDEAIDERIRASSR